MPGRSKTVKTEISRYSQAVVPTHNGKLTIVVYRERGRRSEEREHVAIVAGAVEALVGERVRVRVRARDVSLALARPAGLSVLNVLPATLDATFRDIYNRIRERRDGQPVSATGRQKARLLLAQAIRS